VPVPVPAAGNPAVATDPAPPPLPRTPGVYGGESEAKVVLRASQKTWLRIYTPAGQTLFQRVLEPGEIYRAPNQPDLLMHVGNLGGIEVVLDGRTLPPLGLPGVARSNIPLSPARLAEPAGGGN
jgi:cytoskeleton protein RodZ